MLYRHPIFCLLLILFLGDCTPQPTTSSLPELSDYQVPNGSEYNINSALQNDTLYFMYGPDTLSVEILDRLGRPVSIRERGHAATEAIRYFSETHFPALYSFYGKDTLRYHGIMNPSRRDTIYTYWYKNGLQPAVDTFWYVFRDQRLIEYHYSLLDRQEKRTNYYWYNEEALVKMKVVLHPSGLADTLSRADSVIAWYDRDEHWIRQIRYTYYYADTLQNYGLRLLFDENGKPQGWQEQGREEKHPIAY